MADGDMRIRQPAHEISLCDGLSVRYTFFPIRVKNHKRSDHTNLLKLSLYSASFKKRVGKSVQLEYTTPTKKIQKAKAAGVRPEHPPTAEKLLQGVQRLLERNSDLRLSALAKTQASEAVLGSRLAGFWVTSSAAYCNKYAKDDAEAAAYYRMMTQVLLCFGDLDLRRLLTENGLQNIQSAVRDGVRAVIDCKAFAVAQHSISRAETPLAFKNTRKDEVTEREHEYAILLRNLFREYLMGRGVSNEEAEQTLHSFAKSFVVRPSTGSQLSRGLRSKSLSVAEYQQLWQALTQNKKDGEDAVLAAHLLMLFLGLSAEEVCALTKADLISIPYYNSKQLRITKRCIKDGDAYRVSFELARPELYRNVPVPRKLYDFLSPFERKPDPLGRETSPLLPDPETHHPMAPDSLMASFRKLFAGFPKTVFHFPREDDSAGSLTTSFQPDSYRQSCRHFWQYVCGLQQNEIRYLAGMAQIDTAGRHYIDFNNAHKQYRMLCQMNYGIMAIAAPGALPEAFPSGDVTRKNRVDGVFGHILHLRVTVRRPGRLRVHAAHGFSIRQQEVADNGPA